VFYTGENAALLNPFGPALTPNSVMPEGRNADVEVMDFELIRPTGFWSALCDLFIAALFPSL
jgi:hypothetical protein